MKHFFTSKAVYLALAIFSLISISQNAFAHWTSRGPYGGSVRCFTVIDTTIYAGTLNGGVFRSTNASGTAWTRINYEGLTSGKIVSLGSIGNVLIAGTQDSGIYVSNNKGNLWIQRNSGFVNQPVMSLLTLNGKVYAATLGAGIFVSDDTCKTWTSFITNLGNLSVTSLVNSNDTIFAGTIGGGVFYNGDGTNWVAMNNGSGSMYISTLAVNNGQLLQGGLTGIYITNRDNVNWVVGSIGLGSPQVSHIISFNGSLAAATTKGVYGSTSGSFWVDISAAMGADTTLCLQAFGTALFAGTREGGVFSTNMTTPGTWTQNNTGLYNVKTSALVAFDSNIVVATDKGIYVSRNQASTYTLTAAGQNSVNDFIEVNGLIFGATFSSGVILSNDTGSTWSQINSGLGSMDVQKLGKGNGKIYAMTLSNGIYVSSATAPFSWTVLGAGLPSSLTVTDIVSYGDSVFVSTTTDGVYLYKGSGSWNTWNNGLNNTHVSGLAILNGNIYAGTRGGGVFKASLSSGTWTASNTDIGSMDITSIATGWDGYIFVGYRGGVDLSIDNGATWEYDGTLQYLPAYAEITAMDDAVSRLFVLLPWNSALSNSISEFPPLTGLPEKELASRGVQVFPNPSQGNFSVKSDFEISEMQLLDLSGKLISVLDSSAASLNLQLPAGVYLLNVKGNGRSETLKLVIQ